MAIAKATPHNERKRETKSRYKSDRNEPGEITSHDGSQSSVIRSKTHQRNLKCFSMESRLLIDLTSTYVLLLWASTQRAQI